MSKKNKIMSLFSKFFYNILKQVTIALLMLVFTANCKAQFVNKNLTFNSYVDTSILINVSSVIDASNSLNYNEWEILNNTWSKYFRSYEVLNNLTFNNNDTSIIDTLYYKLNDYNFMNQDSLIKDIFRNKNTDIQKIFAAYNFMESKYAYWFYPENKLGDNHYSFQESHGLLKFINCYGHGACGTMAVNTARLLALHLKNDKQKSISISYGNHEISEIYIDSNYIVADANENGYFYLNNNKNLASFFDVQYDPYLSTRAKRFNNARPFEKIKNEQTYDFYVNPNYNKKSIFSNGFFENSINQIDSNNVKLLYFTLKPGCSVSYFPNDTFNLFHSVSNFPYPIKFIIGNGAIVNNYTSPNCALNKTFDNFNNIKKVIYNSQYKICPINNNLVSQFIVKKISPYPIVSAVLKFNYTLSSIQDSIAIYFSKDNINWQIIFDTSSNNLIGSNYSEINLNDKINANVDSACYSYLIKVKMFSGSMSDSTFVSSFIDSTVFQYSLLSGPSLLNSHNNLKIYRSNPGINLETIVNFTENNSNNPPSAPSDIIFPQLNQIIDTPSIIFKWNAPIDLDGDSIKDYQIQISELSNFEYLSANNFDQFLYSTNGGKPYFDLKISSFFIENKEYYWRLRAQDSKGSWSAWSTNFVFKVKQPSVLRNLHFELIPNTIDSLKLVWSDPKSAENIIKYKMYINNYTSGVASRGYLEDVVDSFMNINSIIIKPNRFKIRLSAINNKNIESPLSYVVHNPYYLQSNYQFGDVINLNNLRSSGFELMQNNWFPVVDTSGRSSFFSYDTSYFESNSSILLKAKKAGHSLISFYTVVYSDTVLQYCFFLHVGKKPLLVTAKDTTSIYGAQHHVNLPDITYSGFANNETSNDLISPAQLLTNVDSTTSVGMYPIIASGAVSNNYDFVYNNGNLQITKKPLLVTANSCIKTYGDSNIFNGFKIEGFVNNQTDSIIINKPKLKTNCTTLSDVGNCKIFFEDTNIQLQNYKLNFQEGNLEILKRNLKLTLLDTSRNFGTETFYKVWEADSLVNLDEIGDIDILPNIDDTTNKLTKSGIYEINLSGGEDNNYNLITTQTNLQIIALNPELELRLKNIIDNKYNFEINIKSTGGNEIKSVGIIWDVNKAPIISSNKISMSNLVDLNNKSSEIYDTLIELYSNNNFVVKAFIETLTEKYYSNEIKIDNSINSFVFPNPNSGIFYLNCRQQGMFHIYSNSGGIIYKSKTNGSITKIDLSGHPSGIYYLKTNNGDTLKITLKK